MKPLHRLSQTLRHVWIVAASSIMVSCSSVTTRKELPPSGPAVVLYSAKPSEKHIDPPGPRAPLKREPEESLASQCLHPVATGLAVAGRASLGTIFVACLVARPDIAGESIEKLLAEPLP